MYMVSIVFFCRKIPIPTYDSWPILNTPVHFQLFLLIGIHYQRVAILFIEMYQQ